VFGGIGRDLPIVIEDMSGPGREAREADAIIDV
jgi:hypothetical protein